MKSPLHLCIECDEAITEPICPGCLSQRMQEYVEGYDEELASDIQNLAIEEGETNCIFCGSAMNLCAHCFSREVHGFLEERDPRIAKGFIGRFDFDLRRSML